MNHFKGTKLGYGGEAAGGTNPSAFLAQPLENLAAGGQTDAGTARGEQGERASAETDAQRGAVHSEAGGRPEPRSALPPEPLPLAVPSGRGASVRGACAALSSCLLLACALSAAAVGLKCFSLGSELKGEPFRLGTAAGAFYSGLLLAAGLSLLAAALLCCRPPDEAPAAPAPAPAPAPDPGGGAGPGSGPGSGSGSCPGSGAGPGPCPGGSEAAAAAPSGPGEKASPGGRQNFLLLGVLVFMLGVLSAFAGAVIDGDTVSLVERKYSHYCLLQPGGAARPRSGPAVPDGSAAALRCQKLRDYQRGLVLSTVFNALECLLGLLNLLLVKNYKASHIVNDGLVAPEGDLSPPAVTAITH
ncbi:LOW QUALITY PROTEIN: transmembrane protein 271 [Lagopus leucura]|uniref:LOW QUALITY PROTEIN: transmembrane protein 271 n=1 Tax=Lagopus leucura TaxID=30410 RepID=UPI001C6871E2|nr:LOW QUALITY PROTEIN: transmembrane protein 271 [Lagopus leucura]